ncbi:MAG: phage portal protein [Gemmatimonadales bacterium]
MASNSSNGPNTPAGGAPIEGGVIRRLAGGIQAGVRLALSGKTPQEFFGPGQSLAPVAQEEAHGRAFDYPTNVNTTTRPRSGEAIDFRTLRDLADNYDLVRLAIETRKDQMGKLTWTINRADGADQDDTAKAIEAFLREPDGEHDFLDWSRMLLEDLLVIDAPAVYIRPTLGGQPFAFEQIDGATILRVLDERGRTPLPPAPGVTFDPAVHTAYQQIIKGLPATNYHTNEMIYKPRNPRVHKVYGFSPVEQLLILVNIGLRRQVHQLAFYTAGNIPEMLMATPATWNPGQIEQFQKLWDQLMQGDLQARRTLKFVPGDLKPVPLRPETSLFDVFDEWLARVVCYCFSLPPTAFVKQQNRATAESAQEAALEEGLAPLMEWKVNFVNRLIRRAWNTTDYVFAWLDETATDPLEQAQIDSIYLGGATGQGKQVRSVDEIRDDHGWGPAPSDVVEANTPAPPPALVPPGNATAGGAVPPASSTPSSAAGASEPGDPAKKVAGTALLGKRRARSPRHLERPPY